MSRGFTLNNVTNLCYYYNYANIFIFCAYFTFLILFIYDIINSRIPVEALNYKLCYSDELPKYDWRICMKKKLVLITLLGAMLCLCSCTKKDTPKSINDKESAASDSIDVNSNSADVSSNSTDDNSDTADVSSTEENTGPTLTYLGHASTKITTSKGTIIYIDPYYYEGDYSSSADIILITHDHSDHNKDSLCTKSEDCQLITAKTALVDDVYQTFTIEDVKIEAVPAGGNNNHLIGSGVGYILTFDDLTLYQAGDTSYIEEMDSLADRNLDYALFPIDGKYNMDAIEATRVAGIVGAKNSIPIHEFDSNGSHKADDFTPENALKLDYGETTPLSSR